MKTTNPNFGSKQEMNDRQGAHPWLQKHYQEKRERTIRLVQASVDQLVKEQQTVTIEAICRKSIGLDPAGRGVKKSAILENEAAHAYYRKHSTSYQMAKNRNRKVARSRGSKGTSAQPLRIDLQRNADRARYRYLQMTKPEIVDRLLTVEQGYAEVQQQLAHLQFQLLEQELKLVEQQRQERRQTQQKGGKAQDHDGAKGS